jgi:hypothetical protein
MNAKFVKPAANALGLVAEDECFGWHRFRHSLSTWANETTKGITVSQTMPRHAKRDTTAIYARELWEGVGRSARLHGTTAADDARLGVNPMKSNHRVGRRAGNLASRTTSHFQMVESRKIRMVGAIGFEPMSSVV